MRMPCLKKLVWSITFQALPLNSVIVELNPQQILTATNKTKRIKIPTTILFLQSATATVQLFSITQTLIYEYLSRSAGARKGKTLRTSSLSKYRISFSLLCLKSFFKSSSFPSPPLSLSWDNEAEEAVFHGRVFFCYHNCCNYCYLLWKRRSTVIRRYSAMGIDR